jgi:hypothetical protein
LDQDEEAENNNKKAKARMDASESFRLGLKASDKEFSLTILVSYHYCRPATDPKTAYFIKLLISLSGSTRFFAATAW